MVEPIGLVASLQLFRPATTLCQYATSVAAALERETFQSLDDVASIRNIVERFSEDQQSTALPSLASTIHL